MINPNELDSLELKLKVQQKIEEYYQAEQEGQPHAVLVAIYKQIKELKYKVTMTQHSYIFS